jgi:hypothetical protein
MMRRWRQVAVIYDLSSPGKITGRPGAETFSATTLAATVNLPIGRRAGARGNQWLRALVGRNQSISSDALARQVVLRPPHLNGHRRSPLAAPGKGRCGDEADHHTAVWK